MHRKLVTSGRIRSLDEHQLLGRGY